MKQVGNNGISPCGSDGADIPVLYGFTFVHSAGGYDLKTVIVHIDMYLFAHNDIVAVDQCVDKRLGIGSLRIIRYIYPFGGFLNKTNPGIIPDEINGVLQQIDQVAFELFIVYGIIKNGRFIKPVPTGTEGAGVENRFLIGKQHSGISKMPIGADETEGEIVVLGKTKPSALQIRCFQQRETVFLFHVLGRQRIKSLIVALENKLL